MCMTALFIDAYVQLGTTDIHLKLIPTSILDILKVFECIDMVSIGR